jgi:hypothetical protein
MEARPHPLVEAFVGRLLPPACREHVLGDLHERYVSASQYVHDAVRTIPFVIWGQIRRTSSAPLVTAEVGVVYVAFLSALGMFDPSALSISSAPLRAGIPAFAALAVVVLRDAWIGRRPRPNAHIAADAVLGIGCAACRRLCWSVSVHHWHCRPMFFWQVLPRAGALVRSSDKALADQSTRGNRQRWRKPDEFPPSNDRGRMQRDLRYWWWTIAVLGVSGWLGLFMYPAMSRYRPVLLAWLIAFAVIGVYQRRRRSGRSHSGGLATTDERRAYRAELERRRDEQ